MYENQQNKSDALCKLFLGGLKRDETFEDQLREYFGQYGSIKDCVVMKDSEKNSRGFGFVTMGSIEETDSVVMAKDEDNDECHKINGKKVEVKRAIPKDGQVSGETTKKLFIAGFKNKNLTEDDFRQFFTSFCPVVSVKIVTDKETNMSKGFGFVELANRHMVDKLAIMEKHEINGISIVTKKATNKDESGGGRGGFGGGRGGGGGGGGGGFGNRGYRDSNYSGGYGDGGSDSYGGSSGGGGYGGGRRGGQRGGRGGSGGYGQGSGGGSYSQSGGGNSYDNWGNGSSGYDMGSNYAGGNSTYGPVREGYGGGGGYSSRGSRPY